jgi:hypothetical protein
MEKRKFLTGIAIAGPPPEGDLLRPDYLRVELRLGRLFHGAVPGCGT